MEGYPQTTECYISLSWQTRELIEVIYRSHGKNSYTTVNSPYANLEILYQLTYRKLFLSQALYQLTGSYSTHRRYTNLLTGSCFTRSQEAMPLMGPVLLTYKKLYYLRISLRNSSLLETATHKKRNTLFCSS